MADMGSHGGLGSDSIVDPADEIESDPDLSDLSPTALAWALSKPVANAGRKITEGNLGFPLFLPPAEAAAAWQTRHTVPRDDL
jgi:hypothetical protein